MTNEEAIASIKAHCRYCRMFPKCVNDKPECFLAIEMAIEALQQQNLVNDSQGFSQGDYISRQAAIDAIEQAMVNHDSAIMRVVDLPSAQRTGEWLRYGEDGNPNEEDTVFWQCDQCLETYTGRTTRIPNYCPNCGADMRGAQE